MGGMVVVGGVLVDGLGLGNTVVGLVGVLIGLLHLGRCLGAGIVVGLSESGIVVVGGNVVVKALGGKVDVVVCMFGNVAVDGIVGISVKVAVDGIVGVSGKVAVGCVVIWLGRCFTFNLVHVLLFKMAAIICLGFLMLFYLPTLVLWHSGLWLWLEYAGDLLFCRVYLKLLFKSSVLQL